MFHYSPSNIYIYIINLKPSKDFETAVLKPLFLCEAKAVASCQVSCGADLDK